MTNRWTAVVLVLLLFALLSGRAVGQELERISGERTGWWLFTNASAETINSAADEHAARITDLEVTSVSPLRFSACLVKNRGAYASDWWWYSGIDGDRVSELLDELKARIIDLEAYYVEGKLRFAVILVPNTGSQAKAWWWYYGVSADTLSDLIVQHDAHLVDLEVLTKSGQQRYAAVMIRNTEDDEDSWSWHTGISPGDLSDIFSSQPVRILDLEWMSDGGFAVILFRPRSESWTWWWWFGLDRSDVTEVVNLTGGRIVDVEHYTQSGFERYAVVLTGSTPSGEETATVRQTARDTYPVEIVLSTTSDWTVVELKDGEIEVGNHEITRGSEAGGLEVEASATPYIAQDCCDTELVEVRLQANLYLSNPSGRLQIEIDKGHIGKTTVALHVPGNPVPIHSFNHEGVADNPDGTNTRTFSVYCPYLTSHLVGILSSPLE